LINCYFLVALMPIDIACYALPAHTLKHVVYEHAGERKTSVILAGGMGLGSDGGSLGYVMPPDLDLPITECQTCYPRDFWISAGGFFGFGLIADIVPGKPKDPIYFSIPFKLSVAVGPCFAAGGFWPVSTMTIELGGRLRIGPLITLGLSGGGSVSFIFFQLLITINQTLELTIGHNWGQFHLALTAQTYVQAFQIPRDAALGFTTYVGFSDAIKPNIVGEIGIALTFAKDAAPCGGCWQVTGPFAVFTGAAYLVLAIGRIVGAPRKPAAISQELG
jgi:hypothetical protein